MQDRAKGLEWRHSMKIKELEQRLIIEGIPKNSYCIYGGFPWEAYCLNEYYGTWEVYYSEKGNKTGLKLFKNEDEACEYFYNKLISDLKIMGII